MTTPPPLVFLLDVDNTLLDNDRAKENMAAQIEAAVGEQRSRLFWRLYEQVRGEHGYVDFPGTVARWEEAEQDSATGTKLMKLLDDFPYEAYLYPEALQT